MSRRGIRLAPGIYAQPDRYVVTAKAGSGIRARQLEERFPRSATLRELQAWQEKARTQIREDAPTYQKGTLGADVLRYLNTIGDERKRRQQEVLLESFASLWEKPRGTIKALQVRTLMAQWEGDGYAASTINHRRSALMSLYHVLDGKRARTPCDDVPKVRTPDDEPRGVPYALIEAILTQMPDRGRPDGSGTRPTVSQTKARLRVMAYAGISPAEFGRLLPTHVNLDAGTVWIPGRKKGRGTKPRLVPLIPHAVEAFRAVEAAKAWGAFSTSAAWGCFRRACRALLKTAAVQASPLLTAQITTLRPYDLRHSFGTAALLAGKNLHAVSGLMGHANLETTRRYTGAAVDPNLAAAAAALHDWLATTAGSDGKSLRARSSGG